MIRVVNKYKDSYDIYIGRGSLYGNPFTHLQGKTKAEFVVATRDESVEAYAQWVVTQPQIMRKLPELRNKVLGCFCAPKRCHGHILVELLEKYTDAELRAWCTLSES